MSSSRGDHGEDEGGEGEGDEDGEAGGDAGLDGGGAHLADDVVAVGEVGEGLDVAGPQGAFSQRGGAGEGVGSGRGGGLGGDPLGPEGIDVAGGEGAELAVAGAAGAGDVEGEEEQREVGQEHEPDDDGDDLEPEMREGGALLQDAVADLAGGEHGLREQEGREGEGGEVQEPQSAGAIGVEGVRCRGRRDTRQRNQYHTSRRKYQRIIRKRNRGMLMKMCQ